MFHTCSANGRSENRAKRFCKATLHSFTGQRSLCIIAVFFEIDVLPMTFNTCNRFTHTTYAHCNFVAQCRAKIAAHAGKKWFAVQKLVASSSLILECCSTW